MLITCCRLMLMMMMMTLSISHSLNSNEYLFFSVPDLWFDGGVDNLLARPTNQPTNEQMNERVFKNFVASKRENNFLQMIEIGNQFLKRNLSRKCVLS